MRTVEKSILEKVLIDMGFKKDSDGENALAGWFNLGDNSISIKNVQRIVELVYDETNDVSKQKEESQ